MEACRNNTQAAIILGGDFNADGINWDTISILPDCGKKSIWAKNNQHFLQVWTLPATDCTDQDRCHARPIRDQRALTREEHDYIPGIADHDTLLIDSDIQTISSKKPHRKVLKWSQGNCNELGKDTAEFAQKYFSEEDTRSSEENYAAIDRHLKTALNKHISSGYTRTCITAVRRAGV